MKADNLSISKVFSGGGDIHYALPHFQREYTWEKGNWKTLLNDALAVCQEIKPEAQGDGTDIIEHFLGSIVVIQDGMRSGTVAAFKLVDGQQRLTTISLLLKALAKLIEPSHASLAKKVDRLLINSEETGDLYFKILPTVKYGDRASYCSIIRDENPPNCSSKIPLAYTFLATELSRRMSDGLNPESLLQVLVNSFQVVFISLDPRESPYRIFESLNAKGKPLSQADLVRNYIAMRLPASHQEKVFTETWSKIEDLLQETRTVGRLSELTAFLRHYLAMRTGVLCDEKHVYARFRDRAEKDFAKAEVFEDELENIARYATHYDRLIRPEKFEESAIERGVARLNDMEFSAGYPFLLHLFENYANRTIAKDQVVEALGTRENYMVRRYLAHEPPSYLNRMLPVLWNDIKVVELVPSLRIALSNHNYPNDKKLRRTLEFRALYAKSKQVRKKTTLVFETLNRHLSQGQGGYTVLDGAATIEHIMPQTLTDEWKNDLGVMWEQIHRDYLHSVGNLTLVTSEWNSGLSNGPFSTKREKLASNALALNATYFGQQFERWGRDQIRERFEHLLMLICDVWPPFFPDQVESDEPDVTHDQSKAEFHFEALERIAMHLGCSFKALSQALFESSDSSVRLVGVCSKQYDNSPSFDAGFWFGFTHNQHDYLERGGDAWVAFECESFHQIILFPFSVLKTFLPELNTTEGKHWHVVIKKRTDKWFLTLPASGQQKDVTEYVLVHAED